MHLLEADFKGVSRFQLSCNRVIRPSEADVTDSQTLSESGPRAATPSFGFQQ